MQHTDAFSAAELEAILDDCLEVELSFRNTHSPAQKLATLGRAEQDLVLSLVKRLASTQVELGYQLAEHASDALGMLDGYMLERWALHAADVYDRSGLRPALEVIRHVERFTELSMERASGIAFHEEVGVLLPFVRGLAGRRLKLEQGDAAYTDTETIFLPAVVARLPSTEENFLLYKAMVAYLWAQTRFGTFRAPLDEAMQAQADPPRFLALFHALETLRLDACISRELPGLHRDMQRISGRSENAFVSAVWQALAGELSRPEATAQDSLRLAQLHIGRIEALPPRAYQGELRLDAVMACVAARLYMEKTRFRLALRQLLEENSAERLNSGQERRITARRTPDLNQPEGMRVEVLLDGQPLVLPEVVNNLLTSIVQDLGALPEDYLVPAGPGEYDPSLLQEKNAGVSDGVSSEEEACLYPEWDFRRQHYRKSWCTVREKTLTPQQNDFVQQVLHKYSGLIKTLRRTFEALRGEDKKLKKQYHGDDVDIDALVEAVADMRSGMELSERLFTRMHKLERNIAVLFMVDMSGSTKGWINDAEREALILLCESLELLGDRYAIYGFSGMTRNRCEIFHIKHFDEPYDGAVQGRIAAIAPQDYTRMGAAIRHLTKLLNEVDARIKLLITLSDGKPDDLDHYRGAYGIEDTRQALMEAKKVGVHPFCITIDTEARDYLPHLYGAVNYVVLDKVGQLPLKVSDIYRRLTTA